MRPSVGRIVHYVSYGTPGGEYTSQCRAAIVTEVDGTEYAVVGSGGDPIDLDPPPVSLCVLNPSGMFFNEAVQDEDSKAGGTWHWPERADGGLVEPTLITRDHP